jgi:hypothetical protein
VIPLFHDHRSAGAHAVRFASRHTRRTRRSWRRRSRRAQVSAVATILGLLLVVVFIANYLSTTLPNQMGQNDLERDVVVQNQVAELGALLQRTAQARAVGAQVSAPITLGSAADPPFAGQDSGSIVPLVNTSSFQVNFSLSGPVVYSAPTGGPAGGIIQGSGCVNTAQSITCSGAATIIYNFTGALGGQTPYSLTLSGGGSAHVNISSSHATVTVTASATTLIVLDVLGSNDAVTVTVSNVPENILILGNSDTVSLTGSATSSFTHVVIVGNQDTVTTTALSGTNTVVASVYGTSDTVNPGVLSGTEKFGVYFNGFNTSAPSTPCPVDDLAGTDTVSQPVGGGTFGVTYNNTTGTTGSRTNGVWGVTYQIPTPFACPFFSTSLVPVTARPPVGNGFVVQLHNTYAPSSEVAYDEGAAVYAQPSSLPIFVLPPRIDFANGVLSMFVPQFSGRIPVEAGAGTADANLRLQSTTPLIIPSNGYSFLSQTKVTITIVTPYAATWFAYFQSYTTLSPYVTCTGGHSVCTALYEPNGVVGTVKLAIPVSGLELELLVGVYSFSLG